MGALLHLVQRGGTGPVANVTAHPSTASVPITLLLYNGPLLCSFNEPIKGLKCNKGRAVSVNYKAIEITVNFSQVRTAQHDVALTFYSCIFRVFISK